MNIVSTVVIFFLVTNPIGNAPAILSMVKEFDFAHQRRILLREVIIALMIALFFQFFGELFFMKLLNVKNYTTNLTGGILLLLTAIGMIFPSHQSMQEQHLKKEPFIVPIATPLLSGPGLLTIIMLKASQTDSVFVIFISILIAWAGVALVLMMAPYLQKILRRRGMLALEQLMGMVLIMMSIEMIVKGVYLYQQTVMT